MYERIREWVDVGLVLLEEGGGGGGGEWGGGGGGEGGREGKRGKQDAGRECECPSVPDP